MDSNGLTSVHGAPQRVYCGGGLPKCGENSRLRNVLVARMVENAHMISTFDANVRNDGVNNSVRANDKFPSQEVRPNAVHIHNSTHECLLVLLLLAIVSFT